MRHFLIVIRLLLMAVAVAAGVAAISLGVSDAGSRLHVADMNLWSGLMGMFVVGAGTALIGAVSPNNALAHPAGVVFALVPLLVLLLIRFYSGFDNAFALAFALAGAICALLALLLQPPAALALRASRERRRRKSFGATRRTV